MRGQILGMRLYFWKQEWIKPYLDCSLKTCMQFTHALSHLPRRFGSVLMSCNSNKDKNCGYNSKDYKDNNDCHCDTYNDCCSRIWWWTQWITEVSDLNRASIVNSQSHTLHNNTSISCDPLLYVWYQLWACILGSSKQLSSECHSILVGFRAFKCIVVDVSFWKSTLA